MIACTSVFLIDYHHKADMLFDEQDIARGILQTEMLTRPLNQITVTNDTPITGIAVYNDKNKLIHESGTIPVQSFDTLAKLPIQKRMSNKKYLNFALKIQNYRITAQIDIEKTKNASDNYLTQLFLITMISLFLFLLLSAWIVRKILLQPLIKITQQIIAAQRSPDSASKYLITDIRDDELGALALETNKLLQTSEQHYKLLSDEIAQIHQIDPLTKIPSRNYFIQLAQKAIADNNIIANIQLHDLAALYNTLQEDELAIFHKMIVKRIRDFFPTAIQLGRIAELEYSILLPNINETQLKQSLISFNQPYIINDNVAISPVCQLGFSTYPHDHTNTEKLLKYARIAAEHAYKCTMPVVQFKASLDTSHEENKKLILQINQALENSSFHLAYQPQYSLPDRKLIGCEALVRWQDISPTKFIPLIEQSGLMPRFCQWLLKETLLNNPLSIKQAINIPGTQVNQHLVDTLMTLCKDPSLITLELTETELLADLDESRKLLQQLSDFGFKIAVDDFGTGYSSLAYIKMLPIDILKIDRSFIQSIDTNRHNQIIVRSIIDMGHNLDISILAEGIETQAELDILVALNCDAVQGYFTSKPVSLEEIKQLSEVTYAQ